MDELPIELLAGGGIAASIALIAWLADRRRMRRSDPDAVGFMPWTAVFFWALFATCVALVLGLKFWMVG